MSRKKVSSLLLLSVMVVLMACAPQVTPAPPSAPPAPAPAVAPAKPAALVAPAKPAWEVEWEKTLAAAKEEGKIVIRTSAIPRERQSLIEMAKRQGLAAEIFSGRSGDILPRVTAERRAGLYLNDIYIEGPMPLYNSVKPTGLLEPLDSVFILPDVTDPERIKQVWYGGRFPWVDQEHTIFIISLQPQVPFVINTGQVKPEEVKSFRDLLNPKWKGVMAAADPTVPGAAQSNFMSIYGIMGEDFVRQLAKMEPNVIRDDRLVLEWVAHGKVPISLLTRTASLPELYDMGAPIKGITPVEGTQLEAGVGGVAWFNKAAHPNAAKVLLNYLMTKEGQEIWSPPGGYHSVRLDVSTAHLRPEQKRQEGVKYFDAYTEKAALLRKTTDPLARDLFGPLIKK